MNNLEKAIKESEDGVLINVSVSPNSNRTGISGFNVWRNAITVTVKSPPKGGKANKELIKLFKDIFKRDVEIVKGEKSTQKILLIKGISKQEVMVRLNSVRQFFII